MLQFPMQPEQARSVRNDAAVDGRKASAPLRTAARLMPWLPWLDRKGRLSPLRAATFALLWVPGLAYAIQYELGDLGPRPVHAALLAAGAWTIWWMLISLAVTPAKALLGLPNLVVVRRMIGLAAFFYGAVHLSLYAADENWRMLRVASEIVSRFYLAIGFATLAGLAVLSWTSRDSWVKRLGPNWKQLHRFAYPLTALGVFHYYLQSKADVSAAVLASGLFAWLMLWRLLPAGRDRDVAGLTLLAVAAGVATAVLEFAWYGIATRVDPWRVLHGELDISFGLRPAAEVLALGALIATTVELRRLSLTRHGEGLWRSVLLHAAAGLVGELAAVALNWGDALNLESAAGASTAIACVCMPALLGGLLWGSRNIAPGQWLPGLDGDR